MTPPNKIKQVLDENAGHECYQNNRNKTIPVRYSDLDYIIMMLDACSMECATGHKDCINTISEIFDFVSYISKTESEEKINEQG